MYRTRGGSFVVNMRVKLIGFGFGLFCLLLTWIASLRLIRHLADVREAWSQGAIAVLFDIGGNALLVYLGILGVLAVILLGRRGYEVIRDLPCVAIPMLISVFGGTVGGVIGTARVSHAIPAAIVFGLMGLVAGWGTLRELGLPITARVCDAERVRQQRLADLVKSA